MRAFLLFAVCLMLVGFAQGRATRGRSAPYVPDCTQRAIDTHGWSAFVIRSAPVTLMVPADSANPDFGPVFYDSWNAAAWEMRVDVSPDSASVPLAEVGGPLSPTRKDSTACEATVAGRPMHISLYRQPSGELHGEYVVAAIWPLAPGGWIRIGAVSATPEGQALMMNVVRTLRFDTGAVARQRSQPQQPCAHGTMDVRAWPRHQLRLAPVSVALPPDAETHWSAQFQAESFSWNGFQMAILYRLVRTPGWQLVPRNTNWHTCRTTIDGHDAGVMIGREVPNRNPDRYTERAFINLAPGQVLEVIGASGAQFGDAPDQFLSFLQTIRIH